MRNKQNTKNTMKEIIYPDECYKIVGILFGVFKSLGYGLREKDYQEAVAKSLGENNIPFKEQAVANLLINGKSIRKYYLDFLINDKIVLEIKAKEKFYRDNIAQVYSYLKSTNLKLGIIANFTTRGVQFKRIVNIR